MKNTKPGRPLLDPKEPLDRQIIVRISRRMRNAFRRHVGARRMAAVVRELIAQKLKGTK